jgi:excisionase family DNA binding protein
MTASGSEGRLALVVLRANGEQSGIITIKQAARMLGVSEPTLRRWDEAGKFTARRHPINGYRLYDRAKVLAMRRKIFGRAA